MDVKKDFPWFKNNPDYVYLDTAATSLKPQCVIDRILKYYECECTNPHNTDSLFTMKLYNEVQESRRVIAKLINADEDEIAFNSGATEGLNLIANGIKHLLNPGDEIILTYGEHASNILPWQKIAEEKKLVIKYVGQKHQLAKPEDYYKVLSEKTKVVAFASSHNLTGEKFDENTVTKIIKDYNKNIFVVIDATQSLQHRKFDVKKINCDFLVCSAHKLFGPTGIGMSYIKKINQDKLTPLRFGGDMNFEIYPYKYELKTNIEKFEGGTQNIAGILGWKVATEYLLKIGYDAIREHEKELNEYAIKKLSQIPNLTIYNENAKSATIAFNYNGVFSQDLASYLGSKKIIVRSGLSCAKLYCNILDTKSLVRASFSIYTTKKDIDYLYNVLSKFKKGDELNVLF